ncbi:hypothetical protein LPJ63_003893 [Coemansia sp. RSA 2711]|nr:hypothetical protein LPJ63_003893 [Coemansia sp. RSA 2711]
MNSDTAGRRVELLVRSPSVATADDFKISMHLEQTISDVKAAIEQRHQAMPLARNMRIIWKGRILKDQDLVSTIYDTDEWSSAVQTVHFVMSTPVDVPKAKLQQRPPPTTHSECLGSGSASKSAMDSQNPWHGLDAGGAEAETAPSTRMPTVVPLGNQFQYVLVDGVPYLMEQKPQTQTRSTYAEPPAALAAGPTDRHDTPARGHEMQMRLMGRANTYANAMARYDQLRDAGAAANVREPLRAEAELRRREPNHENAAQLADMIRGFGFNTVWSFVWMLLRMLLLVVVLAHDASMGRMLMLLAVIATVMVLRSAWAQQYLQRLNELNIGGGGGHAPEPGEQREYSALEKARALVIGLVTSLVPAEPFNIPAADA